jgi:uncharacterized protein (TIGR02271 family)
MRQELPRDPRTDPEPLDSSLRDIGPRPIEEVPRSTDETEPIRRLELREEELVAHKELEEVGEVVVRTAVDEVPSRLEVEALREEVQIQHEPVGQVVSERREPWEEDDSLIVPLYEEQLVVVKRLVLREQIRVRRVKTTTHQAFDDTVRKDRLVVEDPSGTGRVRELMPTDDEAQDAPENEPGDQPGLVEKIVRRTLM